MASSSSSSSSDSIDTKEILENDNRWKWILGGVGALAGGYFLYRSLFGSKSLPESSHSNPKLSRYEIHLRFSVVRTVMDARNSGANSEQAFDWDIVIAQDYFYHIRPLRDGSRHVKVYFFQGPHCHQIAEYFENTQKYAYVPMLAELHIKLEDSLRAAEILKQLDSAGPDLLQPHLPNLDVLRKSWAPLEKQTYTGFIFKDQQHYEQLPGNLFGGQIEYSSYDPSTQRSSSQTDAPIPRPDHGVSYHWSATQEEVVDCTPLTPEEVQTLQDSGCFTPELLAMLHKALGWLLKVHPEILKDILHRSAGFPPQCLWYRHLHDTETVFEKISFCNFETKPAAAFFVPPPSISTFAQAMASTPDVAWNAWIESKFERWEPTPQVVAEEAVNLAVAKADALKTDAACFEALLAIQEQSLQFSCNPSQSLGAINALAEQAASNQFPMSLQYLTCVSQLLMQSSPQMQRQIAMLLDQLAAAPGPRAPVLNYWRAAICRPQGAIELLERLLDYNPYLISIWIELASQYSEVQEIEKSWLCRAVATKLDPTQSHPSFENQHKHLEQIIRAELSQFL